MYICVCSGVTETQILEAVAEGAKNLGDLRAATGCASNCCQCVTAAVDLLDSAPENAAGLSEFPTVIQSA